MWLDCIRYCDALDGLRDLSDATIPLTLWRPPQDVLRDHGPHDWDPDKVRAIADELWRVAMPGGFVISVFEDAFADGGGSDPTNLHTAYFGSLGFRLDRTLYITTTSRRESRRGWLALVFSKGTPRIGNLPTEGRRPDTWTIDENHQPSIWEALAEELILPWSRPGDIVLDPMAGAGTTCKIALLNDRHYLGFVSDRGFHRLAEYRMSAAREEHRRRLDDWLGCSHREATGLTPPGRLLGPGVGPPSGPTGRERGLGFDGASTPWWLFHEIDSQVEELTGRPLEVDLAACEWNKKRPLYIDELINALRACYEL